jgi:hypothetical protein
MTIEDRLQRAARELRSQTERLTVPDLPPRASRSRHRLVVALAATTALVLVAAMLAIVATRGGEEDPAGAGSWEKVPFEETGFGVWAEVRSVARGGPGLVAVGYETRGSVAEGFVPGRVWTSTNGRRWDVVAGDQFNGVALEVVVDTPNGLLAFGQPVSSGGRMSVWRSSDGTEWELVTDQAPSISHVVVGGPGLVAAGAEVGAGEVGSRTAFWTSRNGRHWDRVPGDDERFPSGSVMGLARTGDAFVAVGLEFELVLPENPEGFDEVGALETDVLVWTSPDGEQWRRIRDPRGLPELAQIAGSSPPVAVDDARFLLFAPTEPPPSTTTTTTAPATQDDGSSTVLLCGIGPGVDAAFESVDGSRWERVTRRDLPFDDASSLIEAHDRLLVAAGEGTCESTRTTVYLSEDGRRWDLAVQGPPSEPGEFGRPMAMSATRDGAVVLVGNFRQTGGSGGPEAWVWTAP